MPTRLTILSLFDYTGNWPWYFGTDKRYRVVTVDIKHGQDILDYVPPRRVHGILAAPPCTHFSVSGSQYWPVKDADGRTAEALALVMRTLDILYDTRPEFWILENPVGRLRRWMGRPDRYIDPFQFAGYSPHPEEDRYTKKTGLWGRFELPEARPLPAIRASAQGSWLQRLGGKSERTKELRSATPMGFAKATYLGNRV